MNKEEYKKINCLPMYYLEQRNKQLELADEMVNQIYWYDGVVNKLAYENKSLKQALNEIREICYGSDMSKQEYDKVSQIIDKYKKED